MINHYYWPTPNGHKTAIMLEEVGLDYELYPINILEGEQFDADFIAISPNNRVPAIVDLDGPQGKPFKVFESGAILMYLAEKSGMLWPCDTAERYEAIQWLMFQMGNVGPMFGQNGYFQGYCPEEVPLAKERYHTISNQLYGVLDTRLASNEYLAGSQYSIADVATFPWMLPKQQQMHRIDIKKYPNFGRWIDLVAERPAVQRGITSLEGDMEVGNPTKQSYGNLFGGAQFDR
jgi:GST-like protein